MIALIAIFAGLIVVGTEALLDVDAALELEQGFGNGFDIGVRVDDLYGSEIEVDFDAEITGTGDAFSVGSGCAGGRCGQISYGGSGVDLSLAADGITSFTGPFCLDYYRGFGCASSYNWPYSAYGRLSIGSFGAIGTNLPYVGYNGYGSGVPSYPYPYSYRCVGYPNCLPQPYPVDIPRPVYPYAPGLVTAGEVQRFGLPDFQ